MSNNLQHVTISFCEPNGDGIEVYNINDTVSAIIPNVGDKVNVDGTYREVTEKAFTFSPKPIIVQVYLKEIN